MQTTRFFVAALALLSVLSCQKEQQQVIDNSEIEGANIITCTFAANDAATKTTLDGMTPKWAAGDEIVIYNSNNDTLHLTLASSGTASSRTGIISEKNSKKFTFVRPDGWEDVYAIYPSVACVNSYPLPKLKFSEQDGTFGKANICVAAEISGMMSFKNVGAILKFPSKPAEVTSIKISALDSVNKNYSISFVGAMPSLTPAGSTYLSKAYAIGSGTDAIYIGVPSCTIPKGSAFAYRDTSNILGSYVTGAANTTEANKIYTLPAVEANEKLPGAFTVGTATTVQFSKGNLQATCTTAGAEGSSTYSWEFAENQYDYVGDAAGNKSIGNQTLDSKVDLFGWVGASSTVLTGDATKYGISTSQNEEHYGNNASDALKADWGTAIDNNGTWRTLSNAEWIYLLNTRSVNGGTKEGHSYQRATVNSKYGLIIYPDSYTSQTAATSYTSADWSTMESAGCVFLPAAGYRLGSNMYEVTSGYYWSSTPNGTQFAYGASNVGFGSSSVDPTVYYRRNRGLSVRLVSDVQ